MQLWRSSSINRIMLPTPIKDYTQDLSKFRINGNQALDMEITKDLETSQYMLPKEKSQHPCLNGSEPLYKTPR